jgi:hypothetical protein
MLVKITRIFSKEKLTSAQFGEGKFQRFKLVVHPNSAKISVIGCPKQTTSRIKLFIFKEAISVCFNIIGNTSIQILGSRGV